MSTPVAITEFERTHEPIETLREKFLKSVAVIKKRDKYDTRTKFIEFGIKKNIEQNFFKSRSGRRPYNNFPNDPNIIRQYKDPKNYEFRIYTSGEVDHFPVYSTIELDQLGTLLKNGKIQDYEVDFILDKSQIMSMKSGYPAAIRADQVSNLSYGGGKRSNHKKTRRHAMRKRSRTRRH